MTTAIHLQIFHTFRCHEFLKTDIQSSNSIIHCTVHLQRKQLPKLPREWSMKTSLRRETYLILVPNLNGSVGPLWDYMVPGITGWEPLCRYYLPIAHRLITPLIHQSFPQTIDQLTAYPKGQKSHHTLLLFANESLSSTYCFAIVCLLTNNCYNPPSPFWFFNMQKLTLPFMNTKYEICYLYKNNETFYHLFLRAPLELKLWNILIIFRLIMRIVCILISKDSWKWHICKK